MWVLASFRRRMWPLLGRSTLECLRVLDWIDETFAVAGPRVAGGVSMGGDIAVALAGVDRRIGRVAALVATPDWTRPGMRTSGTTRQSWTRARRTVTRSRSTTRSTL
jgi:enterochelin esterase-like enzyme